MKVKVIIRPIASKPPTKKQRSDLLDKMYQAIVSVNSTTQRKVAVQNHDNVFILHEDDKEDNVATFECQK